MQCPFKVVLQATQFRIRAHIRKTTPLHVCCKTIQDSTAQNTERKLSRLHAAGGLFPGLSSTVQNFSPAYQQADRVVDKETR
jgi:hypothetical protein